MPAMSFPLGSLQGDGSAALASTMTGAGARWRRQLLLLAGAVAWVLFVLAMATHDAGDTAFTTSGTGEPLRNVAGVLGARLSDVALFLFGFSAWWLVPVTLRAWLSALAVSLRAQLPALTETIRAVRGGSHGAVLKILVGGRALAESPDLAPTLGADGYAADPRAAVAEGNLLVRAGNGDESN